MSTFGGLLSEIEGISVDRFDNANLNSRAYFLSHCHTDHMRGLCVNWSELNADFLKCISERKDIFLYASEISCLILKSRYPQLEKYLKILSINEPHIVRIPGIKNRYITVHLIPAGHCPGSVMFLFETMKKRNILYTGDFRLSTEDLPKIRALHNADGTILRIDKIYLDTTFWNEDFQHFPLRKESCDIICDIITEWINKGPDYIVFLNTPAYLGSEYLYMEISEKLCKPIHVNDTVYSSYRCIAELDKVFTFDRSNVQIHNCVRLNGRKPVELKCHNMKNCKIRQIKPSALRWRNSEIKENKMFFKESDETFFVCYSSHSSFNELKEFIEYFTPKEIVPCVVTSERAEVLFNSIQSTCQHFLEVPCVMPEEIAKSSIYILDSEKKDNVVKVPTESSGLDFWYTNDYLETDEKCKNKTITRLAKLIEPTEVVCKKKCTVKIF